MLEQSKDGGLLLQPANALPMRQLKASVGASVLSRKAMARQSCPVRNLNSPLPWVSGMGQAGSDVV